MAYGGSALNRFRSLSRGEPVVHLIPRRSGRARRGATVALALVAASLSMTTAAAAEGPELVADGGFDLGPGAWWSTAGTAIAVVDGELCATVPGGTAQPWDAIVGLNGIPLTRDSGYRYAVRLRASAAVNPRVLVQMDGAPYTTYLDVRPSVGAEPGVVEYVFQPTEDNPNAQLAFQVGGLRAEPWTLCIDDVSLTGGAAPPEYEWNTDPRIHVNQVAYLPAGPKLATLTTNATEPLPFVVHDAAGAVIHTGTTVPRGVDPTAAELTHSLDFSALTASGTGYRIAVDGAVSHPFDLTDAPYEQLRKDALSWYYPMRSGIAVDDAVAPGYGRPAGHLQVAPNQGDLAVPCAGPKDPDGAYTGPRWCDYTQDVQGGWYDAGDHGKYVVNGGIAVWQLMAAFERTKTAPTAERGRLDDGTLAVPERGNAVPDILDEARWELEFLLRMQIAPGRNKAGMAFHSVHDQRWTGLGLLPSDDPQPRELTPPTTAATLNLAAVAAHGARLFAPYDAGFSGRLLTAAERAWAAAQANPAILQPPGGVGGGAYDDQVVADEFYWAAAELFLTTGVAAYRDAVTSSPLHTADIWRERGFDWGNTAALGRLDLATVPNALPDRERVRASVVEGAGRYRATQEASPYGLPYAPADHEFDWGSNNLVLNNAQVMATAFDLTGDRVWRDAHLRALDYVLGRNAINQSYVTGYGEVHSHNQHNRWFDHQEFPDRFPPPPAGSLAGGPNSMEATWDPVATAQLQGCREPARPQFCYIDDVGSWATNEVAINWNSTLSWAASFVADQDDGRAPAPGPACAVAYRVHGSWPGGFIAGVVVTNEGTGPLADWEVRFSFLADQRVTGAWGGAFAQAGATVTVRPASWNRVLPPGGSVHLGFLGARAGALANPVPDLVQVNGRACRSG
jgi:endoglucanase